MAQLSAPFDAPERAGYTVQVGLAAAAVAYPGGIIALNSSGYGVAASDAAGLVVIGRCEVAADNTTGAAGALTTNVKRGVFRFTNSANNPVAEANIGSACYVESDSVVATATTYKLPAGIVIDVDPDGSGVWVDMTRIPGQPAALAITSAANATATPTDLASCIALTFGVKNNFNGVVTDLNAIKTLLQARGIAL